MNTITHFSTAGATLILLAGGFLTGCGRDLTRANSDAQPVLSQSPVSSSAKSAMAIINPTQGNQVRGTVRFVQEGKGVRVMADLTGLTPGEHGFHVHENADCSAPDASSAGDHFNPTGHAHAGRDAGERHVGDLGNITADASGRARLDYLDTKLALSGEHSIVGRSVVVHAKPDDLKSQPSGDSGARVGCGTIAAQDR
jgi:Cu-Zn family superoxide dismutase